MRESVTVCDSKVEKYLLNNQKGQGFYWWRFVTMMPYSLRNKIPPVFESKYWTLGWNWRDKVQVHRGPCRAGGACFPGNVDNHSPKSALFELKVFEWQGLEKETEEMRPQWWDEDKVNGVNFGSYLVLYCVLILFALLCQVPFSQMWPDDELWFPHMLRFHLAISDSILWNILCCRGERFKASFVFEGHDKIVESNIET